MAVKREGYFRLAKIRKGKRIREITPSSKRTGIVTSGVRSAGNGWFRIKWDGDREVSSAHANWFYSFAQLRKYGLA